MTVLLALALVVVWPALAFLLGVIIGRGTALGQQRRPGEFTHTADVFERSAYGREHP